MGLQIGHHGSSHRMLFPITALLHSIVEHLSQLQIFNNLLIHLPVPLHLHQFDDALTSEHILWNLSMHRVIVCLETDSIVA